MKKPVFLLVLLLQISLLFGQNDSLVDTKSIKEYRFSIGVDAFFGPASGINRYTDAGGIGFYVYGSVRLANHNIIAGLIIAPQLTRRYISGGNQTPSVRSSGDYTPKGLTIGYKYKPSLLGLNWLFFEYKFNIYQEHYIIFDQHIMKDNIGSEILLEAEGTDTYATVINNSIGIGIHSKKTRRIAFKGSISAVLVNYFSDDYEYWENHQHLFHPSTYGVFNPKQYFMLSIKTGIIYNFGKRKKK